MSLITWWPNGGGGGAVTFAAVNAALALANATVDFNGQDIENVDTFNALTLRAGLNENTIYIGEIPAGGIGTVNRVAIGLHALELSAAISDGCVAIGVGAQALSVSGERNVSVGHGTLANVTTGDDHVAIGDGAGAGLTTGNKTVSIGAGALGAATTASGSVAIGYHAGLLSDAADNVFIGDRAGVSATSASNIVAVGRFALSGLTTGIQNVAVGQSSGPSITTQNNNVFIGNSSGANAASAGNIVIGAGADTPDAANPNGLSIGNAIMGDLTLTGTGPHVRIGGSGTVVGLTELLALVQLGADTVPVVSLQTTGANGAKCSVYVGSRDPSGAVSALGGSHYYRVSGATSGMYLNKTAGTGTTWSLVTVVP